MVTISVCMIVKNETAVLARCLDSLEGLYDELIIVDTGSTDDTKAIAGRYTDKVYDITWVDDFSAARNAANGHASCDYIYSADADEVLDDENRAKFALLKSALLPQVEVVEFAYANQLAHNTVYNFDVEYRPKLFARIRTFEFMDPIHEVLRTDPIVFRSDITVTHCPQSQHGQRDLAILAQHTAAGRALSPRLAMMYARELMIAGNIEDFEKAAPYFEKILASPTASREAQRQAACVLAWYAAQKSDGDMLLRVSAAVLADNPPAEVCCALGDYFYNTGHVAQAAGWYDAALSGAQAELIVLALHKHPLLGLARCHEALGNAQAAQAYRDQAQGSVS